MENLKLKIVLDEESYLDTMVKFGELEQLLIRIAAVLVEINEEMGKLDG